MGRVRTAAVIIGVFLAVLPCAAASASGTPQWVLAVRDCAWNGRLDQYYPRRVLEKAISELPSDGNEYTDCLNALRAALEGGAGRPPTPVRPTDIVTESGAVAASPADVAALQTVQADAAASLPPVASSPQREATPGSHGSLALPAFTSGIAHWNDVPLPLFICVFGLGAAASFASVAAARRGRKQL